MKNGITWVMALIFLLVYTSCRSGADPVLSAYEEEEIIEILIDVSLARAHTFNVTDPELDRDSLRLHYYSLIGDIHGLEQSDVIALLESLSEHPELFHRYFNAASDSLRKRNARLERR